MQNRSPSLAELRLTELQLWAISRIECVWLTDIDLYRPCRVAGVVQQLRLDPDAETIEATIEDGTGVLLARWHLEPGAAQLSAVPGTGLVLDGVPVPGDDGIPMMQEPAFETAPFPDLA